MAHPPPAQGRSGQLEVRFGDFVLERRLAVGGMAEIFLARDLRGPVPGRAVVIKRILPQLAHDPTFVRMFVDEAQLVAHLRHPNVVRVFDFGDVKGQYYLAMEYVDGLDAWRLLRRCARAGNPVPAALAAFVASETLKGLEYVHAATDANGVPLGIVHSDISPSNVYVSRTGDVKIGDFGIARARQWRDKTEAGMLTGKYGYMAPEQVLGRTFDHRADLFAVGVVLAELLTGEPLFTGTSKLTVLLAVRDVRVDPIRARAAEFPPGLLDVTLRALARDPADRYLTAESFRMALDAVADKTQPVGDPKALGDLVMMALSRAERDSHPSVDAPTGAELDDVKTPDAGRIETPVQPEARYALREPGEPAAPALDFARVVERLVTGQLSPSAEVSVDRGPFKPIRDVAELWRHLPSYVATTDIVQTPTPEAKGDIEDTSVVGVLGRPILSRATGLVIFDLEPVRKEVYLIEGRPEFVASNLAGELLGEFLVTNKVISRGELEMALAVMPRFGGHLGESLVALGLVNPVQVIRFIAQQVKDKLLELFRWRKGRYTFYRDTEPPSRGFPLGLDPIEILTEGIRTGYSVADLEVWLSERRHVRVVRPDDVDVPPSLPVLQRKVLEELALPVPLGSVHDLHGDGDRADILRALFLGVETGTLVTLDG